MRRNRKFRVSRISLWLMLVLVACGFICQAVYLKSSENVLNIDEVNKTIRSMERKADKKISEIAKFLETDRIDSLMWIPFEKLSFTYLVYENDELIFWSDNQADPVNQKNENWKCRKLSNIYALVKSKQVGDFNVVSYIPLKHNFPYENKDLQNEFVTSLNLPKEVSLTTNSPADKFAVFDSQDQYLFTLRLPEHKLYNESWSTAALIFFFLAFATMFIVFARFPLLINKTRLSWREFFRVAILMLIFILACLIFNFPATFFQNKLFTPYVYASSTILATLSHLTFLTGYLFAVIYLFSIYVIDDIGNGKFLKVKQLLLLSVPGFFFVLIYSYLVGVVFNSSTEINILRTGDVNVTTLWNHFLYLIWGISFMMLHVKIHKILLRNASLREVVRFDFLITILIVFACHFLWPKYGYIAIIAYILLSGILYFPLLHLKRPVFKTNLFIVVWLLAYTVFISWTSIYLNRDKKFEKYRVLTENHYTGEDTDEDRIAISLFDELNQEIIQDRRITQLVQNPDSVIKANEYINSRYLRGFWNKYEMRLFGTMLHSEWDEAYNEEINSWGKRIKSTNFYRINNPKSDLAFLGAFENHSYNGKNFNFYMEFYPKKAYKSYSFPDLLIENSQNILVQESLSSARYTFRELVSSTGSFVYENKASWIAKNNERFFSQEYRGYTHYIYVPDRLNYYVLSEVNKGGIDTYVLYSFYVFIVYVCLMFLAIWLYRLMSGRTVLTYRFSSRYLVTFIILLVLSFVSIFIFSANYMRQKYVEEQKLNLESTKNYIQMTLQEKYYWQENLDSTLSASLNFDLQDLSYIYHTDIHVYDNTGKLIGSSQPALFSRGLTGHRISPIVYFSQTENNNQYEKIGNLEYLTAYTDLYNGDFLQIGYIAVPQFLSNELVQKDMESFLTILIHIYLVIIILFVLLSLIITRQLSSPLTLLHQSLKQIKLGQENKKIIYKPKDEIGQLVEQYNKTVEQLETSAQLLAKSERESAWKTMARQVAHEINNPLTPMKLSIQHLKHIKTIDEERFNAVFDKSSDMLIEQIENLSRIAGTFSSFAKLPESNLRRVDVAEKVRSVSMLFSNNTENVKVTYQGEDSGLFTFADRELLILVFNNLMKNAIQAIPNDREGLIDVKLEASRTNLEVSIKDNGSGMTDEVKEHLFTPNFTTKASGMGLGLSISRNVIQMLGGTITFKTKKDVGTEFKVILPRIE